MFTDVNVNDAKAAVKVWAQTIARERDVPTDPEPSILTGLSELTAALRGNQVDAIALTADEYEPLSQAVPLAPIFGTRFGGRTDEEYVLLVHGESGITNLANLRGRSLATYQNPRASLAPFWLDTLLAQRGLPPRGEFLGKQSGNSKLPRVVLPVFFRQSEACLVTRSGFDTMNEMNPQVGKTLKVLATSPKVVPAVFCLRANYAPPFKEKLLAGLRDLHATPAGQQVLTIFHSERLVEQPASCMNSALELLAAHRRLCVLTNAVAVRLPDSDPVQPGGGR
jgi:phosphonate transport system substrate-binding protein